MKWMRRILHPAFGAAALLLAIRFCESLPAEDIYFEVTTQGTDDQGQLLPTMNESVWVSGNKMRRENTGATAQPGMGNKMIMRGDLQMVYIINDAQRTYIEMPIAQITGMAAPMVQQTQFKVQKTGRTRKINEWNCEEYVVTVSGPTTETWRVWATRDVKVNKDLMGEASKDPMMKAMAEQMKEIEGFPIEITIQGGMMGPQAVQKRVVTRIKQDPIPPTLFELPPGYMKAAMPTMPAMPPGGMPQ